MRGKETCQYPSVVQAVGGPRLHQELLGLLKVIPARLHGGAKALVLEDVIAGTPSQADDQATPADVVHEGGLDR